MCQRNDNLILENLFKLTLIEGTLYTHTTAVTIHTHYILLQYTYTHYCNTYTHTTYYIYTHYCSSSNNTHTTAVTIQ